MPGGLIDSGSKGSEITKSTIKPGQQSEKNKNESKSDLKYQPIKQFLPISLKQQLHTISIAGFKSSLNKTSIDKFLAHVMELTLDHLTDSQREKFIKHQLIESWSHIFSTAISEQTIFVRFNVDLVIYPQVVLFLSDLFSDILKVKYDSNVKTYIEEELKKNSISEFFVSGEDREKLSVLIKEANVNPSNMENDGGNEISSEYQIDLNTLNDIPRDALDQLCKDIIEFRTRVVTIEKEKNRQEIYNERERQRSHMMKMFDKIKMNNTVTDIKRKDEKDDNEDILIDDFEEIVEHEKQEAEKRYEELLIVLNRKIEPELRKNYSDLQKANNYEKYLMENKSLNKKEISNLGSDELYDNHRSFKELEEQDDKEDREKVGDNVNMPVSTATKAATSNEESKSVGGNAEEEDSTIINIKFAFNKAIDNSVKDKPEEIEIAENEIDSSEQIGEPNSNMEVADILPFTGNDLSKRLDELRTSKYVDELVKEYLGVYEDELVDYIFENISEHRSRQVLLDDLKETFDEDAIVMVNNIWKRKEFIK